MNCQASFEYPLSWACSLFPPSLADFLGPDDEVHIFREVTAQLDISYLDADFKGTEQHPYHPGCC